MAADEFEHLMVSGDTDEDAWCLACGLDQEEIDCDTPCEATRRPATMMIGADVARSDTTIAAFMVTGEGPSGWKVIGPVGVFVQGTEKNATWVAQSLNNALRMEAEAEERGG